MKQQLKRIGFVTCVRLGLSCLEEIYRMNGNVELLITLKDTEAVGKSGRVYLDQFALEHNVPLIKVKNINDNEVIQAVYEKRLDWLFIIGWSQIAKRNILNAPIKGCIGMHPTLLPEGRGRASIPWAILKELPQTGVTMFKLNEGMDTGDIIDQKIIPLSENITASELYQEVEKTHITILAHNWNSIINDTVIWKKQDETRATIWPGRTPNDGRITELMNVRDTLKLIRAVTHPYPGAFMDVDGKKWRIWSARESEKKTIFKLKDGYIEPLEFELDNRSEV